MTNKTLNVPEEDKALLDLLTDEERAGLEEGADFDEDQEEGVDGAAAGGEGDKAQADGKGDAAGNGDAAGEGEDDAAAAAAAEAAAAAAGDKGTQAGAADDGTVAAAAAEDDPADLSFVTVPPVAVSRLPEDYDDKVKEVTDGKKDILKQFEEGDIGVTEYHEKMDALNRTERELERIKDRVEDNEHRRYEVWTSTHVKGFMQKHTEYSTNQMLTGLLDQEVRKLQASGKYESDTDPKILADAHKQIAAAFPGTFKSSGAAPASKSAGTKTPVKAPAKHNSAPSLARVPAANIDNVDEGEFDGLDRLLDTDPLRYQAECEKLARTDPAKYDRYLATQ